MLIVGLLLFLNSIRNVAPLSNSKTHVLNSAIYVPHKFGANKLKSLTVEKASPRNIQPAFKPHFNRPLKASRSYVPSIQASAVRKQSKQPSNEIDTVPHVQFLISEIWRLIRLEATALKSKNILENINYPLKSLIITQKLLK